MTEASLWTRQFEVGSQFSISPKQAVVGAVVLGTLLVNAKKCDIKIEPQKGTRPATRYWMTPVELAVAGVVQVPESIIEGPTTLPQHFVPLPDTLPPVLANS